MARSSGSMAPYAWLLANINLRICQSSNSRRPRPSPAADPPQDRPKNKHRRDERRREQPERPVEDRLGLHACFHFERRAGDPIAQRLLPRQDVAALDTKRRVVKVYAAR